MAAPARAPQGMINVVSTAQMQGKLELFGFGSDERAISPGDLVIVSTDYVGESFHRQKVEFCLRLKGRDMHLFVEAAKIAEALWEENKEWLNASIDTPNLDQRGRSEKRLGDSLAAIAAFYPPPPTLIFELAG